MAVAQESLVIDVSATDALTPKLEEMRTATKELGAEAKKSFGQFGTEADKAGDRASKGLKKAGDASDVVAKKFRVLAKAAIGIFAADIVARVFGFRSGMDAINKGADRAARSIQAFMAGASVEEFERRSVAAKKLAEIVAEIAAGREAGRFRLDVRGAGGLGRDVDISRFLGNAEAYKAAAAEIARAQERINAITGRGFLGTGLFPFGLTPEQTRDVIAEQRKLNGAIEEAATRAIKQAEATERAAEAQKAAAESQKEWNKRLAELQQSRVVGEVIEPFAVALAHVAARASAATAEVAAFVQRATVAVGLRLGLGDWRGARPTIQARLRQPATRVGVPAGDDPQRAYELARRQFEAERALMGIRRQAAIDNAADANSMKAALGDFSATVMQSLNGQVLSTAFEGFRGFFRDVITGAKSAKEAFRDFALNVVAGMADIFAQRLALRAVEGIFGVAGQARGGYAHGGYNLDSYASGGVVHGPRPVMLGDNPSRHEAVVPLPGAGRAIPVEFVGDRGAGRGQTVQINLAVTSLDPRGAADVVLSAMPQIQRALVGALGGTDRALISAVRGA